jgi:low molecular weight protein-tyrosine phosphatase
MIRVLFVCTGNICRSPMAEGLMRKRLAAGGLVRQIEVDSAGTHDYNIGSAPDPRAQAEARRHGIDISRQRARQITLADFEQFDYLIAMDADNVAYLRAFRSESAQAEIRLLLEFAAHVSLRTVPDPYSQGRAAFATTFELIDAGVSGLLDELAARDAG